MVFYIYLQNSLNQVKLLFFNLIHGIMRKFLFFPVLLLLISSCSKDEDKQDNHFDKIIGKWFQMSYLNSDNYFTPQEDGTYIQFNVDASFVYHKGGVINETLSGTYTMPSENVIKLNDGNDKEHSSPSGYRFEIDIKEINGDNATIKMTDGTSTSTIKVQRKN
jgi:hypothetical protein